MRLDTAVMFSCCFPRDDYKVDLDKIERAEARDAVAECGMCAGSGRECW